MLSIKGKKETRVGEAHRNNKVEFGRENCEIQEVMDQGPCAMKWAFEQLLEQAARPPLWADRPTTVAPHPELYPWTSLWPICSIFTCYTFYFELN